MAEVMTGSFVASRACAFAESQFHQRIASGVGITADRTVKRQITASHTKNGFYRAADSASDNDKIDVMTGPGDFAWNLNLANFWSAPLDLMVFLSRERRIRSTPDPDTGTGYSETTETLTVSDKGGAIDTDTVINNGSGNHYANHQSWTIDSESLTENASDWSAYRKYVSGGNSVEYWIDDTNPNTTANVIDKLKYLFSNNGETLNSITDSTLRSVSYDSSDAIVTTAAYEDDLPAPISGFSGGEGINTENTNSDATTAPFFVMQSSRIEVRGQWAKYTQVQDLDATVTSQTSEKLPFYPKVRIDLLANPDNWDSDSPTQKAIDSLTWYSSNGFPAPA